MTRLVTFFMLALVCTSASAHTQLSRSVPADQAALEQAPETFVLEFSEAVRLTSLALRQEGADELDLEGWPAAAGKRFDVAVPEEGLAAGDYVLAWRALSADTHVMTGEIAFSIAAAGRSSETDAEVEVEVEVDAEVEKAEAAGQGAQPSPD